MKSTDLLQLVDNFQQAGKIHNLQQVCGFSGFVQNQNISDDIRWNHPIKFA